MGLGSLVGVGSEKPKRSFRLDVGGLVEAAVLGGLKSRLPTSSGTGLDF